MLKSFMKTDNWRIPTMAALLLTCTWLEYYFHYVIGMESAHIHFFYAPVVLTALWWGVKGSLPLSTFVAIIHATVHIVMAGSPGYIGGSMLIFTGLMTGIIADRRHRAQKALRESRKRFRDVALSSGDWIWEIDKDGKYTFVSDGVKRILGYESSEVIGRSPFVLMPDDEAQRVRETFEALVSRQEPIVDMENWNLTKEGERVCLLTNGVPVFAEGGAMIGYRGVDKDVTRRKEAERALAESKLHLQVIFGVVQAAIVLIDSETHRIIDVNPAAAKMIGAPVDQIVGKVCHEIMTTATCGQCPVTDLGQVVHNTERELLTVKGETIPIIKSVARVTLSGQDYLVESFVSIANRKKNEEELRRNSKLESLGVLAGGIAHDFNNVLAGILGNISLVRLDLDQELEAHELLEEAEKAIERAKGLTNQLLTFAKGGEPIKQDASIEELIRDSVSFVMRGSNVKAHFSFADDLGSVTVDTEQISRVIQNLVINACQAMPEGGEIIIDGENVIIEPQDNIPLKSGNYVKVTIRDEGIGIPHDDLQRIFDPYFTTKDEGHGIGLAVTHSIIKKHGGHIEVKSRVGKGTAFRMYLPAQDRSFPVIAQVRERAATTDGRGRVLVMDDEELLLNLASRVLVRYGYTADCARHGAEAVELYKMAMLNGQCYNAVLLDLTVPGGMGGEETLKKLLRIDPDVKAIVCSGYSNAPVLANYKDRGFCGAVSKPYRAAELIGAVVSVLSGATPHERLVECQADPQEHG